MTDMLAGCSGGSEAGLPFAALDIDGNYLTAG